jgi:hypothetical protein
MAMIGRSQKYSGIRDRGCVVVAGQVWPLEGMGKFVDGDLPLTETKIP